MLLEYDTKIKDMNKSEIAELFSLKETTPLRVDDVERAISELSSGEIPVTGISPDDNNISFKSGSLEFIKTGQFLKVFISFPTLEELAEYDYTPAAYIVCYDSHGYSSYAKIGLDLLEIFSKLVGITPDVLLKSMLNEFNFNLLNSFNVAHEKAENKENPNTELNRRFESLTYGDLRRYKTLQIVPDWTQR